MWEKFGDIIFYFIYLFCFILFIYLSILFLKASGCYRVSDKLQPKFRALVKSGLASMSVWGRPKIFEWTDISFFMSSCFWNISRGNFYYNGKKKKQRNEWDFSATICVGFFFRSEQPHLALICSSLLCLFDSVNFHQDSRNTKLFISLYFNHKLIMLKWPYWKWWKRHNFYEKCWSYIHKYFRNTGWNGKIVVLKKQYYIFILKLLLKKSIQETCLCSRAGIYSI